MSCVPSDLSAAIARGAVKATKGRHYLGGARSGKPRKLSAWSCSAWDAGYDAQSTATVPEDLRRGLEKNNTAREFFSKLNSRSRYAILYQIQDAKKPETRARRLEKCVAMLSEQKKLFP